LERSGVSPEERPMGKVIDLFTRRVVADVRGGKRSSPQAPKPKPRTARKKKPKRARRRTDEITAKVQVTAPGMDDLLDQPGVLYLVYLGDRVKTAEFDCDDGLIHGVEIDVDSCLRGAEAVIIVDRDGVRWVFACVEENDEVDDTYDHRHPFNR
jgi:hypothetical protein